MARVRRGAWGVAWAALGLVGGQAAAADPPRLTDGAIVDRACGRRAPCWVGARRAAGWAPTGAAIEVVEVVLDAGGEEGVWRQPAALDAECVPFEYWVFVHEGARVIEARRALEQCRSSELLGVKGYEDVTLGNNTLTHEVLQGSGSGSVTRRAWRLAPFELLETCSASYDPTTYEATCWHHGRRVGYEQLTLMSCEEPLQEVSAESVVIPRLDGGAAAWRAHDLEACGVLVDGNAPQGYTLHGEAASGTDASMRVAVLGADALVVEVRDDLFVSGAARWIHDDHLELWLGGELAVRPGDAAVCASADLAPIQYGVRLSDGQVFAGHGRPEVGALRVEREVIDAQRVRLRVTLPEYRRLTVVYSDSDDGVTQERLIATSPVKRGALYTLGRAGAHPFPGCGER